MSQGYMKIIVLKELSQKSLTGYDLIKKLEEYTGKRPSPGSIYPLLKDLLQKKLVSAKQEGRKKTYSITPQGIKTIASLLKEKEELMLRNIDLVKSIGKVAGTHEIRPILDVLGRMKTNGENLLADAIIWAELRKIVMDITLNSAKKRGLMMEILKETIVKLKNLKSIRKGEHAIS